MKVFLKINNTINNQLANIYGCLQREFGGKIIGVRRQYICLMTDHNISPDAIEQSVDGHGPFDIVFSPCMDAQRMMLRVKSTDFSMGSLDGLFLPALLLEEGCVPFIPQSREFLVTCRYTAIRLGLHELGEHYCLSTVGDGLVWTREMVVNQQVLRKKEVQVQLVDRGQDDWDDPADTTHTMIRSTAPPPYRRSERIRQATLSEQGCGSREQKSVPGASTGAVPKTKKTGMNKTGSLEDIRYQPTPQEVEEAKREVLQMAQTLQEHRKLVVKKIATTVSELREAREARDDFYEEIIDQAKALSIENGIPQDVIEDLENM